MPDDSENRIELRKWAFETLWKTGLTVTPGKVVVGFDTYYDAAEQLVAWALTGKRPEPDDTRWRSNKT